MTVEKLMYDRFYGFLDKFELLYPLKLGFSEKHSTTHALLSLTESIKISLTIVNMVVEYF